MRIPVKMKIFLKVDIFFDKVYCLNFIIYTIYMYILSNVKNRRKKKKKDEANKKENPFV